MPLEIDQVEPVLGFVRGLAGDLDRIGALQNRVRQDSGRERRSGIERPALEPVEKAPLELGQVMQLGADKEPVRERRRDGARGTEAGLALPRGEPPGFGIALADMGGLRLVNEIGGREQRVRNDFLVGIKLEFEGVAVLAVAAGFGEAVSLGPDRDRKADGMNGAVEKPVFQLGEEPVEIGRIPIVQVRYVPPARM